jgi:hypothetical protein
MQWDIGLRIGATLRSAKETAATEDTPSDKTATGRKSPVPHTRKAHWRTYWTGPGREKPEVKWINMTLVNIEKGGVGPTLHKVEK